MASSLQPCPRFVQNAWKKDLCSNCFKSKEEHISTTQTIKPIPLTMKLPNPSKSIIKATFPSSGKNKKKKSVNFPKEVSEVIGTGGEWSDEEGSGDDEEDMRDNQGEEELVYEDDAELQRLTKTNTEFNTNNGNLLGDSTANIKRSFAALKLGTVQKDATGKKQTLKISVTPFGNSSSSSNTFASTNNTKIKALSNDKKIEKLKNTSVNENNGVILKSITQTSNDFCTSNSTTRDEVDKSPDYDVKITSSNEKSLLEEISETLLSKKILVNETTSTTTAKSTASTESIKVVEMTPKNDVIKVEIKNHDNITSAVISSTSDTSISTTSTCSVNNKRTIVRNNAINLKDMEKPKIQVSHNSKNSESESDLELTSDTYYDVVETHNSYENVPDGKLEKISASNTDQLKTESESEKKTESSILTNKKSHFFSNKTISEMFLTHKPLNDAIKKRAESYDLMDNTFVSSKITCDGLIVTKNNLEDALDSNGSSFDSSSDEELSNTRSESDSGIGIKGNSQSNNLINSSNNSSDYEDIQVTNEINKALSNNRDLEGEPDGRSDPDGNSESSETSPAPALPQSSPPTIDARQSFLHSTINKPKVPLKPISVNIAKPFQKRNAEIIMQLQQVINKEKISVNDINDPKSTPKKSRAPEPPQSNNIAESESQMLKSFKEAPYGDDEPLKSFKEIAQAKNKFAVKTNTVQLKEPRSYPAINPKFRSLNHLNKAHEAQEKLEKFEKLKSPSTPEPAPRHSLSLSSDSLAEIEKAKKKKFSIKKFLRMGNKTETSTPIKKDYSHYADIPTSPSDDSPNAPQVKPRLIIIHPLDINNTGVEVVSSPTISSSYKKPPVPPCRSDSTKLEMSKPTRPPPPKNNELRSKIESESSSNTTNTQQTSSSSSVKDTVYANLGEIRNSIAPRKPERTNSMREREAKALELQRRQPLGESIMNAAGELKDCLDDQEDHAEKCKSEETIITKSAHLKGDGYNRKKLDIENISTRSKIELFESNAVKNDTKLSKSPSPSIVAKQSTTFFVNSDGLKSSVQKMNLTIDSYLKNKKLMSSSDSNLLESRSPTPPQQQIIANTNELSPPMPLINCTNNSRNFISRNNNATNIELRSSGSYEPINVNVNMSAKFQRASFPENGLCSPILTFGNAARSYCGSEIGESEIYSPYSFCGSEAGLDVAGDIGDGCHHQGPSRNKIVSRLRMRKGRSVVHTNLEDNYSAVIVANHEALAQVLDQLQQSQNIPPTLRPLANCLNLRFDDFIILDSIGLVVGKRVFHQALWQNSIYVTLVLTSDSNQMVSGSHLNQMSGGVSGALNPITEFCDLVPNNYLPSMPTTKVQMVQATVTVLPKLQVETLETMGSVMKSKIQNNSLFSNQLGGSDENVDVISINEKSPSTESAKSPSKNGLFDDLLCREVGFIILQLVNGLKNMQAKGIEEMPLSLSNIIMCREMDNKDQQAKLCILQGINSDLSRDEEETMGTLCQCALKVVKEILPETKLTPILSDLLAQERADTLSKTKSVLEYVLWGPSDVSINGPLREREVTLQRWLDLARATVLHGLVRSKIELTIYDECHLIFLVRSNSKIMLEASKTIAENYKNNSEI
ncbi:hypothetical protein PVAND_012934 [Polypedilum vanderplanki]|uniref:Uncharacterized protein n=1 Tax=Polypedilum vanderplanki TaxID=319348 RepID=A0A9J6CPX7_POLVA|nr:hypothetical protein PVAND_012934 [Polypedilum vanderplanki]